MYGTVIGAGRGAPPHIRVVAGTRFRAPASEQFIDAISGGPMRGLDAILGGAVPNYALLHRPQSGGAGTLEVLAGPAYEVASLADLPPREVLAILPYRQLRERGLAGHDDGTPLIALEARERHRIALPAALAALPRTRATLASGGFD